MYNCLMRKAIFAFISSLLTLLIFAPSVFAQEWTISDYKSDLTIQEDGKLHVKETITTNFSVDKHGIFRDIPFIYQKENGDEYYTKVDVLKITRDGKEEKFEESRQGSYINLRIGDAGKTIRGPHTYTVEYTANGVLIGYEEYDELFWNATGNYWDVPIQKASGTVHIHKGEILEAKCFEGYDGSTAECTTARKDPSTISFASTKELATGEGLSIVASFPKGSVPITVIEQPMSLYEQLSSHPFQITFLATLLVGFFIIIFHWARNGRDIPLSTRHTIVVEYTPPADLKPAEIGVLADERADTLDVTSSIVDLATKGYLKIKEIPKKWTFGKVDYELTKIDKKHDDLESYEKELLQGLFKTGDVVKVSDLKTKFYQDLAKVKEKLYADLIRKKYFPHHPARVKALYLTLFIFITVGAFGLLIMNGTRLYPSPILTGLGVALLPLGIFGIILSRSMSRRTAEGAEMYRRIKGYRLFLNNVEKHRQKFFEDKNLFNEILPYAIVFGLTDKIAKAAKEMGIKPETPSWYTGASAFHASTFAHNVSNFSSSVGNSISSSPSSSGFSSGGSSGGGFGGGGGGSW